MARYLGIDLGTTNSCFAVYDDPEARILENAEGKRTTPSAVLWDTEILVGEPALRVSALDPERVIVSVKRLFGRPYRDFEGQEEFINLVPGEDGRAMIQVGEDEIRPEEVAAKILQKIVRDAEARLGEEIAGAVITLPAHFDDLQRQAVSASAALAGLPVLRLLHEPTAAALAFGGGEEDEVLLVFDLGGGTFDISLLESGDDVYNVLATEGDPWLGGDNLDQLLVQHLKDLWQVKYGYMFASDPERERRLLSAAREAKHELSSLPETHVSLPFLDGREGLEASVSRAELEKMAIPLLERMREPLRRILEVEKPTRLLLVGGMTRMPLVRKLAEEETGLKAEIDVQPDEAVAFGAALQAASWAGEESPPLLLDVTPLSLGIETENRVMRRVIEKNTTIPVRVSEIFTTSRDNQSSVDINILQGERPLAEENRFLGQLQLLQIPPAIAGLPEIEVAFALDADGILEVSAKDLSTGEEQKLRITDSGALTPREIAALRAEADSFNQEDAAEKERRQRKAQVARVRRWIHRALKYASDDMKDHLYRALHKINIAQSSEERLRALKMAESLFQTEPGKISRDPESSQLEEGLFDPEELIDNQEKIDEPSMDDLDQSVLDVLDALEKEDLSEGEK